MALKKITFRLKAPFAEIGGEWEVEKAEQQAAWEMYVELATRVSVAPLGADEGLLREALASFYSLYDTTRQILRTYGPEVAKVPTTANDHLAYSFGYLAAWILNGVLRPLLANWHPALEDWEAKRADDVSRREHERAWDHHDELRDEIEKIRIVLNDYAWILADACDAPALMVANTQIRPGGGQL
ncbi:MAG: hypothetical protein AAF962_18860 [Actinomycetota bacterium]